MVFIFYMPFSAPVYIAVLLITPREYKSITASLIILTDPAMLGLFFMGGIWLLEKGEGLHGFWSVSPLRPVEYVWSKSVSLAVLSTVSADLIVLSAMRTGVNLVLLSFSVFLGAVVFNLMGLMAASFARSVNHYMIIVLLPAVLLSMPPGPHSVWNHASALRDFSGNGTVAFDQPFCPRLPEYPWPDVDESSYLAWHRIVFG